VIPYAGAGVAFRTTAISSEGPPQSILSDTNLVTISAPLNPIHTRTGIGVGRPQPDVGMDPGFRF